MRKKITCSKCNYSVCLICFKEYTNSNKSELKCMNCNEIWKNDRAYDFFSKNYIKKKYNKQRENFLFEIEKSRLPSTIIYIEIEKLKSNIINKINSLLKKNNISFQEIKNTIENKSQYSII
jgi:hypothetical protein